uniref:DUF4220 domain-containing protein n=1 Tax=Oryza punctata TaxID=4537 RepID=A0A0E0LGT5_ORYPU
MLAEAREVASCICSNWAKVALICCQLNINKQLLPYPYPTRLQKCCYRHNALRSNNGQLSNGVGFLQDHGGRDFLWACTDGEATSDVILSWHIATSILEAKLHHHHPLSSSSSDNQIIVATHLSRYCAYLVNCWPELLPDDDKWSKSLYDAVTKDSEHGVVKKGVRLGRQLTELKGEEAWSLLAGVWSEMILYVAPSDNLSAHSDAIARGGELITVVWALLMHLGIYKRPRTRPAADANSV